MVLPSLIVGNEPLILGVRAPGRTHAKCDAGFCRCTMWPDPVSCGMVTQVMTRELPFGARITDSFVKKLKWETAKADENLPGALPCLCVEEQKRYLNVGDKRAAVERIDFGKGPEVPPTNRLVSARPSRVLVVKERVWVLLFDRRTSLPETTFEIDGLELHISKLAQAELKGATISVVNDSIVVTHGCS